MKKIVCILLFLASLLVIFYCISLLVFNFIHFDSYYLSTEYSQQLIEKNVHLEYLLISREEHIFTINTKQTLYLFVDDNAKNENVELLSVKIEDDEKRILFYKSYNKSVNDLKREVERTIYKTRNESVEKKIVGKTYILLDRSLKPSKLKYIDLEFILKVNNGKIIKKERVYTKIYPAKLRL
jgi:hypothetical protein